MPNLAGGRNSDQTLKKSSWCGVARPGSFRNKQFREPHAGIPPKVGGHIARNKQGSGFPDGLRISWYKAPSSPFPHGLLESDGRRVLSIFQSQLSTAGRLNIR